MRVGGERGGWSNKMLQGGNYQNFLKWREGVIYRSFFYNN